MLSVPLFMIGHNRQPDMKMSVLFVFTWKSIHSVSDDDVFFFASSAE